MSDLFRDHCEVVQESLQGKRETDDRTFASLEILKDRLDRVKRISPKFAIVEFSPAVSQMRTSSSKLAVV
jgi:hypothetical protein